MQHRLLVYWGFDLKFSWNFAIDNQNVFIINQSQSSILIIIRTSQFIIRQISMDQRNCYTQKKEGKHNDMKNRRIPKLFFQIHQLKKDQEEPIIRSLRQQTAISNQIFQKQNKKMQHHMLTKEWLIQNGNIIFSVGVIAAILSILILIYIFFNSTSCTEMYKKQRCWESSKSSEPNCLKLSNCIGKQNFQLFAEQFLATLAVLGILVKKYWREILDLMRRFNR